MIVACIQVLKVYPPVVLQQVLLLCLPVQHNAGRQSSPIPATAAIKLQLRKGILPHEWHPYSDGKGL